MYRDNQLKKRLLAGQKSLGCWTALDSPLATEVVALAGFDFILVDQEHGFGDPTGLALQLQAMSATPTTSVVRVPSHDPNYTKRILDAGAECIMFPNVNSAAEARAIVDSCRYSPQGSRGLAPGIIRAANYGNERGPYVETANENLLIICQIETVQAVENIEEIVAVEGVDVLFIGPNDLSASNGKYAQYEDPGFLALIDKAESAMQASGKPMAILPYGEYSWQDVFDRGYVMTTAGADISLLRMAAASIVEQHDAANRS